MTTFNTTLGVVKEGANTVGEIRSFEFEETAKTAPDTQLSDTSDSYLVGKLGWTGTLTCSWDDTDTAQGNMLIGSTVTIHFLPEGATTGDEDINGSAIVVSRKVSNPEEGAIMIELGLLGTGDLTHGTA